MTEDDLRDEARRQAYQIKMKALFGLEKFAFVDAEGRIYTPAGVQDDIDQYHFDFRFLTGAEISLKNLDSADKKVIITMPVDLMSEGKHLVVCFMEIDMAEMLSGVSMQAQEGGATFCNIYTGDGVALSNTVLGGLPEEDNLLDAMAHATFDEGYSYEGFCGEFCSGARGVTSFTYNGVRETLAYVPVEGASCQLTYLIRESVISRQISSILDGIIRRSVVQSVLTVVILLGIINDILDMSRIESGRMVIKSEEFSFSKALSQVNTIISGQCRDKGLAYDCHMIGKVDDYYIGDNIKLRQVMINILGNAVKFTPEGGRVTFTVEETARFGGKSTLRFVIRDTGIGMSKEYLPRIFDAFSQEDSSSTNRYGSTGLGMPITKSIVELMNGRIEVESEKGVGTTFTVTVTLLESDWEVSAEESGTLHPHEMCVLVIDDEPIACEHAQMVRKTADLAGRRVLLAEDVAVNAEIMMMVLSMREMQADLAENGRIAVEKFAAAAPGTYDAILMDMRMPEMDGLEATRRIRAMDREDAKSIPIIAQTANAFDEDVQRSMQAGLNAHLSKPVEPENLFETLENLIRP